MLATPQVPHAGTGERAGTLVPSARRASQKPFPQTPVRPTYDMATETEPMELSTQRYPTAAATARCALAAENGDSRRADGPGGATSTSAMNAVACQEQTRPHQPM